jgi:AmmeMemoRadiSam system protein A
MSPTKPNAHGNPPALAPEDVRSLIELARASINHGIDTSQPVDIDPAEFSNRLLQPGASFVTLNIAGQLRGCIGSVQARWPLAQDVAHNAFAAAFRDPRFPPLAEPELHGLEIHISVLGSPVPMSVASEKELLTILRPGVDGLILEESTFRSVFLPQVWVTLPEPAQFLKHLKLKAGLPADYWSPRLRFQRFIVEEISVDAEDRDPPN